MVAIQRDTPTVLIQTCGTLPSSDASWTSQRYLRFEGGSEGCGQLLGEATLVQDFGIVKPVGGASFQSQGIAPDINRANLVDDLVGLVVRLLKEDEDGTITVAGTRYTAFWWGVIQTQTIDADLADSVDTGGHVTWMAVGIACVLDQIALREGWVKSSSGSVVDPGYLPRFNHQPGGERSSSTFTVGGSSVYVHDLNVASTGSKWTAAQILSLLFAGAARPRLSGGSAQYGWTWAIVDADGCLAYTPEDINLDGRTLLQALNALASAARGITWSASVSGSSVTITAHSASPDAVSGGTFTLPACAVTATLDAAGSTTIAGLQIHQDETSTYDGVEVRGSLPWTGLTLLYDPAGGSSDLAKGWSAPTETSWNSSPQLTSVEHVWRRFEMIAAWDEAGYGAGLANTLSVGTSAAYGSSGLTGARSATASGDRISGYVHPGDRTLPGSPGFSTLLVGPRQPPVVVLYDGSYDDLSQKWRVEVQSEPFAVVIDDGDFGQELRDRLAVTNAKLYVTVGMREHQPLRVSWQRAPSDWPRETPRTKLIQVAGCELWRVASGTVTGIDNPFSGTALTTIGAEQTIRDDTEQLRSVLALARAWFTVPAYQVRWTDRGILDTDSAFAPGTLLTSVTLGDRTYGTYALITRRTWNRVVRNSPEGKEVETWDTSYETQRVLPDLESLL
jgi:hypothetical protein